MPYTVTRVAYHPSFKNDFTSVGVTSPSTIWSTGNSGSSCSGPPAGHCLYIGSSPTGTWERLTEGASQITVDMVSGSPYELDNSGNVWSATTALTHNKCGGGTITFVQIAVKNGIVFGLDSLGTVFDYGGVMGNCWAIVGNGSKNDFAVSIAADNSPYMSPSLWASDTHGAVWIAY
jgi:hypothetical protein